MSQVFLFCHAGLFLILVDLRGDGADTDTLSWLDSSAVSLGYSRDTGSCTGSVPDSVCGRAPVCVISSACILDSGWCLYNLQWERWLHTMGRLTICVDAQGWMGIWYPQYLAHGQIQHCRPYHVWDWLENGQVY